MTGSLLDYVPHGLAAAFASVVTYVFKRHVDEDNDRYNGIREDLRTLVAGQQSLAKDISDNHAEVLKMFISAGQHADQIEALRREP